MTQSGWLSADKAPATCPGLSTSALAKRPKQVARDDLMAGMKARPKQDPREMYKFPSLSTLGNDDSSPEKAPRAAAPVISIGLERSISDSAVPAAAALANSQLTASTSGTSRPIADLPASTRPIPAVGNLARKTSEICKAAMVLPPL